MNDSMIYLATRRVAERTGTIRNIYRVADGRFVVSGRTLKKLALTADEYMTGLQGIEPVDKQTALQLIAENGYKKGVDPNAAEDMEGIEEFGSGEEEVIVPQQESEQEEVENEGEEENINNENKED